MWPKYSTNILATHRKLFIRLTNQLLQGDHTTSSRLFQLCSSLTSMQALMTDATDLDTVIACCEISLASPDALFFLGFLYDTGIGYSQDSTKAIDFYNRAIALGHAPAMNNRASMHLHGEGGLVDLAQAISLYEQASELGYALAMTNRAYMYAWGIGGPVDLVKAIALFEQAIRLGETYAMTNRAAMHRYGLGGPVDMGRAIALYEQAIALGDAEAMYLRAYMYQSGLGGPTDLVKAIALFEQAVELGNGEAMKYLAGMYQYGGGGPTELAKAVWLYEQATRQGINTAELKEIVIDKDTANELIELLWDELIAGLPVTNHTLTALIKYSQDLVLAKINNIELTTSLSFLKQLKTNPHHPIAHILHQQGVGTWIRGLVTTMNRWLFASSKQEEHLNLKGLLAKVPAIAQTRMMFFKMKPEQQACPLATLPPELKALIVYLAQPGLKHDAAEQYSDIPKDIQRLIKNF